MKPVVSVIMGVRFQSIDIAPLKRSVDSILAQSFSNFELIICEKESSIEAKEYLNIMSEQERRVRLIDGSGTNHLGGQLNRCIECAEGRFLARMDDDDYSYSARLEKQLEFLAENEDIAFVGSNVRLIQNDVPVGNRILPSRPVIKDFLFVQPFIHPALMFRADDVRAVGGYSDASDRRGCEDYDLLLRMYGAGFAGANIEQTLLDYSLPPRGTSHRNIKLRINEVKTRWQLFGKLGILPKGLPYVIKPLAVGLIPLPILERIKQQKWR